MASSSSPSSGTPATSAAEHTIADLTTRFPGRVQIHLHPSSSLPSAITSSISSSQDAFSSGSLKSSFDSVGDLPVALVWTVDSLKLLRGYGLTGSFTGTLAQFPQQNIFLGLPIQLLPEEVVYLLRRDKAVVVDEGSSYRKASKAEVEGVNARTEADREGQQLAAWHERQLLRAKHAKLDPTDDTLTPSKKDLENLPWHYTIPTTSTTPQPALPWYTPITYASLSSIQSIFPFPTTETEIASVALFEHFLDRSMWCMNGLRFGGAFAVYPGDPLRYHSHYTAQLVLQGENVALTSLVANGRLGTAVKKTHLICHVREFDGEIASELDGLKRGQKEGLKRRALNCIIGGLFDVAPPPPSTEKEGEEKTGSCTEKDDQGKGKEARENGRRFAEFDVFSLAWAGFGT
ncbi:related to RNA splicing endonuclease gamma subunit [Ustilago trichophora]|uniref:tRNA-intron lyase n=1 Tax=Ustilago trichophora TaxID=86804 RepID=A0A5C3DRX9_9BASI|nr:related to RNA splicing endonuclease gamma subunit [Ustilago trichophora]